MARKDHGNPLTTLVLQPGRTFRRSRAGFDTGRAVAKCDQSVVARLAPAVGTKSNLFPAMFVEEVEIEESTNGIAIVNISYLGLMQRGLKAPVMTIGTGSESFTREGYSFNEAIPSVTIVYTSYTRPDPWEPGQAKTPAGFTSQPFYIVRSYYKSEQLIDLTMRWQGWILKERQSRDAGPEGAKLYEVTDTYEYIRLRENA